MTHINNLWREAAISATYIYGRTGHSTWRRLDNYA